MRRIPENKRVAQNRRERTTRNERRHSRTLNTEKKDDFSLFSFDINHTIEKESVLNESLETDMTNKQNAYEFLGTYYYDISSLSVAFAENWYEGQKEILDGKFSKYISCIDSNVIDIVVSCKISKLLSAKNDIDKDVIYFDFLYSINPSLSGFYWRGRSYANISLLGQEMLKKLWENDNMDYQYWDSLLLNNILSEYYYRCKTNKENQEFLCTKLEEEAFTFDSSWASEKAKLKIYYTMAYLLSDEKMFMCNERTFLSIDEFINYLKSVIEIDYEKFVEICNSLINVNGDLDPQFESWLISLGKGGLVEKWKSH